jgi:tetratricopeptide (TPR) repeat protein
MNAWVAFSPLIPLSTDEVRAHWPRLHGGDSEPLPESPALMQAWTLYHRGDFELAHQTGLSLAEHDVAGGLTVSIRALSVYATYLEPRSPQRERLLEQAQALAARLTEQAPENPNAWYLLAYALGRHSQSLSVAKSLALGLGQRTHTALERTLELNPLHADAHLALATFNAEVIDKVGEVVGAMTYGVSKASGLALYERAAELNPGSVVGMLETARGLMMLDPEHQQARADRLYQQLRVARTLDALEALVVGLANAIDD